jgi:DNA-binding FadR family transcriptional regulator
VFVPVESSRVSQAVVEQVEQAILTGELKPGDRLSSERSLMAQFRASRGTIREALRVLESRGLIQIRHGDPAGPLVSGSFGAGLNRIFGALTRANRLSLVDLIQFRMLIEGACAYLAAVQPAARLAPLKEAFAALESSRDHAEMREADMLFHRREAEASGNHILVMLEEALHTQLGAEAVRGLADLPFERARELAIVAHRAVLDAILAGKADQAALISRSNLFRAYSRLVPTASRKRLKAMLEMTLGSELLGTLPQVQ